MHAPRVLTTALVLSLFAGPGLAQPAAAFAEPTRVAPASAVAMKSSFAPVVRRTAPAVVNISAKRVVRQQVDPFWQMFGLGVPQERMAQSLGSGVIVRSDGIVVTNNHVVENGQEITVALNDRREFPAKILLADPRTDLAILKIDLPAGERLPVLAMDDSGDTQVGDLVLAIGDPFGVGQTVTNGIVSALNRITDPSGEGGSAYIQTDAAINPGNSGGALVDMDGDLIGVNSFILSRSGTSSGVGFAIPAAVVRRVVETAVGGGRSVVRPWLGARTQSVTPEMARSLGLAIPQGAVVADLYPNGPAARAGLKQGDVVLQADGRAVADAADLNYAIRNHRPGESIQLSVRRAGGQDQTLALRAEPAPATPAREERTIAGRNPFAGAVVVNLSPAVAEEMGMDPLIGGGVLITNVGAGAARNVGLKRGDIVREVNGVKIGSVRDLTAATAAEVRAWRVTIQRDGRQVTATFAG
ncbi:MAG: Do family serine endopeptidase [Alphaproteobacteria bacterium]|nr:Do family serine endopeptidase [Alphaproteobacteria bacterium]MBU1512637.1 Do family serine endopeptidase [Alphaproteobacteria bacterium]MBU2095031.1 Do family serine endopeptidase [Alphaproteobacteria bacterium]MBU2151850.1 Do family serine endopeptidase [Alphaproteobacteria bacterium]MBU2306249.1 Do family serine endopeptidase [Alphaproteobacteria bacterium]